MKIRINWRIKEIKKAASNLNNNGIRGVSSIESNLDFYNVKWSYLIKEIEAFEKKIYLKTVLRSSIDFSAINVFKYFYLWIRITNHYINLCEISLNQKRQKGHKCTVNEYIIFFIFLRSLTKKRKLYCKTNKNLILIIQLINVSFIDIVCHDVS